MRRSLSGALLATVALVSAATPISAAPSSTGLYGVTIELFGSGISEGSFDFPLQQGQPVTVDTLSAAPGEVIDLGQGSAMVVVTGGSVSHFPDCTAKETWTAGHTYFHSSSGHPDALTVNDGSAPATLVLVRSGAATPTAAAGGGHGHDHGGGGHGASPLPMMAEGHEHGATEVSACPVAGSAAATDAKGISVAYNQDTVMQQHPNQQLQVWRFRFEPGYTTDWHTHPGAVIALQTEGVLHNWNGCQEKEVWDPGYSYFHSPGTHGRHQNLTSNHSGAQAEVLGIFFNVPPEYGNALPPVVKSPPPAECPTSVLTY